MMLYLPYVAKMAQGLIFENGNQNLNLELGKFELHNYRAKKALNQIK